MFADKRALATGGAGFFGSHLCERELDGVLNVLRIDYHFKTRPAHKAHLPTDPSHLSMRSSSRAWLNATNDNGEPLRVLR